jgi:hypothetical protein
MPAERNPNAGPETFPLNPLKRMKKMRREDSTCLATARSQGPEFKPQYHKKNKNKKLTGYSGEKETMRLFNVLGFFPCSLLPGRYVVSRPALLHPPQPPLLTLGHDTQPHSGPKQ